MRILVTGGQGMLGSAILRQLKKVHRIVSAPPHDILDLCQLISTREFIRDFKPNIIINCAAVHDTKVCNENPALAVTVNETVVANLSEVANQIGVKLFHFSTDQVLKAPPPIQDERFPTVEYDNYSSTKKLGELCLLETDTIIRVSALYGHDPCRGKNRPNFVDQVIQIVNDDIQVRLPSNIGCSPGYVEDIAKVVVRWTRGDHIPLPHIIHLAPQDLIHYSWYSFGMDIVRAYGRKRKGFKHILRKHKSGPSTGLVNLNTIHNWVLPPIRNSLRRYINTGKAE